jgi:hypothetical protein
MLRDQRQKIQDKDESKQTNLGPSQRMESKHQLQHNKKLEEQDHQHLNNPWKMTKSVYQNLHVLRTL